MDLEQPICQLPTLIHIYYSSRRQSTVEISKKHHRLWHGMLTHHGSFFKKTGSSLLIFVFQMLFGGGQSCLTLSKSQWGWDNARLSMVICIFAYSYSSAFYKRLEFRKFNSRQDFGSSFFLLLILLIFFSDPVHVVYEAKFIKNALIFVMCNLWIPIK